MIAVGYMAKRVRTRPDWLHAAQVVDIYSVSHCISNAFADYINDWQHNADGFFDTPQIIQPLAQAHSIDLQGVSLFYYEVHELAFDEHRNQWTRFKLAPALPPQVVPPRQPVLAGYDVVSFSTGTSPECSPLSCNGLATEVETNQHCLLASLEQAQHLLESGQFKHAEPGPYRIFAVYAVAWS